MFEIARKVLVFQKVNRKTWRLTYENWTETMRNLINPRKENDKRKW